MEIRRGISHRDSDKALVTFHDVAACFSEEEWKLLKEWQQELYQTVMTEITQALISLGPLIAASVFSLRAKEKDNPSTVNPRESERRHSTDHSPITEHAVISSVDPFHIEEAETYSLDHQDSERKDISSTPTVDPFHIKEEAGSYSLDHQDSERKDISSTPTVTEHAVISSLDPVHIKEEAESYSLDYQDSERKDISSTPTGTQHAVISSVDPVHIKDESESYSLDYQDSERKDISSTRTEFPFAHTDVCLRNEEYSSVRLMDPQCAEKEESTTGPCSGFIKEEETTHSMDCQDSEKIESSSNHTAVYFLTFCLRNKKDSSVRLLDPPCAEKEESSTGPGSGDGSMHRKKNIGESTLCTKQDPLCKASSGETNTNMLQSSDKGTHSRSQLSPETHQELRGENTSQCISGVSNSEHFNLHQGMPKVGISQKCNEYESKPQFLNGLPNSQQNKTPFTCAACDKTYSCKGELINHMRAHSGARPYACTDCEKIFFHRNNLITHRRTHSGEKKEKTYTCNFCHKSFSRKYNMTEHLRIHTGERPYKCTECGESFALKGHLNQHQREHT